MPRRCRHRSWAASLALLLSAAAVADETPARGQLLYVPIYSEVPYGDKGLTVNLSATVSVRNTDVARAIRLRRVDYHGSSGALLRSYLKQPQTLTPLATANFFVAESDRSGGSSASFLVEWDSESPVSPPLVEAVMVNLTYNTGVAFSSPARVIEHRP